MTSLIQYDLTNTLNCLVIMNKYYKQKDKWLQIHPKEKQLPKKFLTHYRAKEYAITNKDKNAKQPLFEPVKENNNITRYDFDLINNANALTMLSYDWNYYSILHDVDAPTISNNSAYLRDFIARMRINNDPTYNDYTVDNTTYLFSPNNMREFYSYQMAGHNFVCADFVSKTLFTLKKQPDFYYKKDTNSNSNNNKEQIRNLFRWKATFYQFSEKNINALILQHLYSRLDSNVSRDALLHSILSLWKYQLLQHKSELKNQNEIIKNILQSSSEEHTFINFLRHLYRLILADNAATGGSSPIRKLTYRNICDFYLEVQSGVLTEKSKNVLDYFNAQAAASSALLDDDELSKEEREKLDNTINSDIKMLSYHPQFSHLNTNFEMADELSDTKLNEIITKLQSDTEFTSDYHINNVYTINYDKDLRNKKKYPDVFWGVHGTSNVSVPSILLNGLKNSEELEALMKKENKLNKHNEDYIKYSISGQALGQGVYFAQLDQPMKSIFFTDTVNNKKRGFLIIANIRYNKQHVYHAHDFNDYYDESTKPSLIISKHVGVRNLNEYVAPISDNIQMKYLIEIESI